NQTTAPTVTGPVAAYALRTNQAINLSGNTLTLGNGTGTAGLILNGGSVTGGPVSFGTAEGVVYASGTTTSIGGSVSANGLTVTALGATALTLGGPIADGTQPSRLVLTGQSAGTSFTLSGANTYTGGTTMSVNG